MAHSLKDLASGPSVRLNPGMTKPPRDPHSGARASPRTGARWPDSVPALIDADRRVVLRPHRGADLARIVEMCSDPEFVRWTTIPHPYSTADGQAFLSSFVPAQVDGGRAMLWALEAIDRPAAPAGGPARFCGTVEIRLHEGGRGEIAFGLHPDARGLGLLRRGGRLALDWAFDVAGLRAIEWKAVVGNWASRHVAASLGFAFEGVRRAALDQRGSLVDCWTATVLPSDPRASVAAPRQPTVRNAGVVLRPFIPADLDRVAEACADPVSQHWLGRLPRDFGIDSARAFLEHCREGAATFDRWTWCITTPHDDRCAGAVTLLHLRDAGSGELAYWAHPDARGHGLVARSARAVADLTLGDGAHGLGNGIHQAVVIRVAVGNAASAAVARHAGATLTGRLPRAERLGDGSWTDLLLFSRFRGRAGGHRTAWT